MEEYIICILHDDRIVQLHSDKHFYSGHVCMRGCRPVARKTRKGAEQVARTYIYNSWGPAFACTNKELEQLRESIHLVYNREERMKRFSAKAQELNVTTFHAAKPY